VVRIETAEEGLYRLEGASLAALGLDPAKRSVLMNRGQAWPAWTLNEAGDLCFWAPANHTRYTRTNVFWLYQLDARAPAPAAALATGQVAAPIAAYEATSRYEVNTYYRSTLPCATAEEDHWFCPEVLNGGKSISLSLVCTAVQTAKPGTVRVMLRSYAPSSPSTHFTLAVNGVAAGEYRWDGAKRHLVEAAVPAGVLVEGALVLGEAVPVRVRPPDDDLAFFQQALEHQLDLEGLVLRLLHTAGDVLEVDEQRQLPFPVHPPCPFVAGRPVRRGIRSPLVRSSLLWFIRLLSG